MCQTLEKGAVKSKKIHCFASMNKLFGALAVFIGAISFGILSTFVKKAYSQGFSLQEVTGIQALLGMFFLWALVLITYIFSNKRFSSHTRKTSKWLILACGLTTGSVSILYYKSVQLVPASLAIVLLMQYLWIGLLVERVFFKSRPSKKQLLAAGAILGSTLLATGIFQSEWRNFDIIGILYGLLAATAYSLFLIVNGRVGNDYPPVLKSAFMITGAFIWIAILMQPFTLFQSPIFTSILPYGLLLSVFGTVLPPLLFAYGIPKTGVPLASILSAAELPVAVCMSYFVLQEEVRFLQWIGVLLIVLIIIWNNTSRRRMTSYIK